MSVLPRFVVQRSKKRSTEKETSRYTEQFDVLKSKLLQFAAIGVNGHLKSATELLCQVQERVFDFFLSCDFTEDRMPTQNELFDNLDVKEQEYINKMRCYVDDNCSKFAKIVEKAISHNRVKIETEATQMQFDSIKIGNVVGRNEVVEQCRRQIKDMVLFQGYGHLAGQSTKRNLCNHRKSAPISGKGVQ
ncbi:hypothetical protein OS493_013037 [Desmophyllum pertusum]|uniref:Uncharacterized protein n=1 Tax=Desmophyllum pertusum TaxID=174260 RepID=A0A9W9Z1I1_9CNID|nr:hypothetical protein OS493_013037 [Desmophyllum pertusum]